MHEPNGLKAMGKMGEFMRTVKHRQKKAENITKGLKADMTAVSFLFLEPLQIQTPKPVKAPASFEEMKLQLSAVEVHLSWSFNAGRLILTAYSLVETKFHCLVTRDRQRITIFGRRHHPLFGEQNKLIRTSRIHLRLSLSRRSSLFAVICYDEA